jgi:hypothetical protein
MQRSPWLREWKEPAGGTDVPWVDQSQADVNLKFQFSVMLEHRRRRNEQRDCGAAATDLAPRMALTLDIISAFSPRGAHALVTTVAPGSPGIEGATTVSWARRIPAP